MDILVVKITFEIMVAYDHYEVVYTPDVNRTTIRHFNPPASTTERYLYDTACLDLDTAKFLLIRTILTM